MQTRAIIVLIMLAWASTALADLAPESYVDQAPEQKEPQKSYPSWELEVALGVAHFIGSGASSTRVMPTILLSGGLRLARHFSVHAQIFMHLIIVNTIDDVDGLGFGSTFYLTGYWHILGNDGLVQPYFALSAGWGNRVTHLQSDDSDVRHIERGFNFGAHIGVPFTINQHWSVGPLISYLPHLATYSCVEVEGDVTSCSDPSSFNKGILGFSVSTRYEF